MLEGFVVGVSGFPVGVVASGLVVPEEGFVVSAGFVVPEELLFPLPLPCPDDFVVEEVLPLEL